MHRTEEVFSSSFLVIGPTISDAISYVLDNYLYETDLNNPNYPRGKDLKL